MKMAADFSVCWVERQKEENVISTVNKTFMQDVSSSGFELNSPLFCDKANIKLLKSHSRVAAFVVVSCSGSLTWLVPAGWSGSYSAVAAD